MHYRKLYINVQSLTDYTPNKLKDFNDTVQTIRVLSTIRVRN